MYRKDDITLLPLKQIRCFSASILVCPDRKRLFSVITGLLSSLLSVSWKDPSGLRQRKTFWGRHFSLWLLRCKPSCPSPMSAWSPVLLSLLCVYPGDLCRTWAHWILQIQIASWGAPRTHEPSNTFLFSRVLLEGGPGVEHLAYHFKN